LIFANETKNWIPGSACGGLGMTEISVAQDSRKVADSRGNTHFRKEPSVTGFEHPFALSLSKGLA
jgi:hypothetical protein